jgi:hypothetical protein
MEPAPGAAAPVDPVASATSAAAALADAGAGWTACQTDLAATWADHALCFQVLHARRAAACAAADAWCKRAVAAIAILGGSTQLTEALRANPALLAWLLVAVGVAHQLVGSWGLDAAAAQHAALARHWLDLHTALIQQVRQPPARRAPLLAFLADVPPRYDALRAQSDTLITVAEKDDFVRQLRDDEAVRRRWGMGAGCGCAAEGLRVPPVLGGRLVHTVVYGGGGAADAGGPVVPLPAMSPLTPPQ